MILLNMAILSGTILLLSKGKHLHLKWMSFVTLVYCLFIYLSESFYYEDYLVTTSLLLMSSGYYMVMFKDKVKSLLFLLIPFILKIGELLIVIGYMPEYIITMVNHFIPYLLNIDYFLISSLLLLLTLHTTKYNITDFEIKDFSSLIILSVYAICTLNVII